MAVESRVVANEVPAESDPAERPDRRDGFSPIQAYGALGDGRTVALVALDGRIDWWAIPSLDAPPAFCALLDPEDGGSFSLAPTAEVRSLERRYVEESNVLQTTFTTEQGVVRVTDALNVGDAGILPWSELARRVEGVSGEVEMAWAADVGTRMASARPWTTQSHGRPIIRVADQSIAVITDGAGELEVDGGRVAGRFTTRPGSSHLVALVATDDEPLFLPRPSQVAERVEATTDQWSKWVRHVQYEGRWEEAVRRSALVLKILTSGRTGAIAAAATTSLPETIGGDRNYDYRYAWSRDMSFTIGAMLRIGLNEEVHGSLSWLLSTVEKTAPDIHVFYTVGGEVAEQEEEVPIRGYRDSRPVRSGNRAASQTQLGTYGDLLDPVWSYVDHGNHLDENTAHMVGACADRVCDAWKSEDSGIWELPERGHYTISKIGCWVALDRACRLAEAGQLATNRRHRWELERHSIAEWVRHHCWSPEKRSYTFAAGSDDLDAAVLLAARTGFDRGERLASTVEAVRAELGRGPLLYRYSQMVGKEGAFLACSFWMVEALAALGQIDEATSLMDELVALSNDVGLYSEEMDPTTGDMLGNFPQALTHLALITAAVMVRDSR